MSRCLTCATVLPNLPAGARCAACLNSAVIERLVCLGSYTGSLAQAVLLCKYQGRRALAYDLGRRAAESRRELLKGLDVVVPVPLGRRRRRSRGYNQAEDVARGVARALQLPLLPWALHRRRETAPQTALSAAARHANLRAAFGGRRWCVGRRRVLLVDDVFTTGATLRSAAQALIAAGASGVSGLTLARVEAETAVLDSNCRSD